MDKFWGVQGYLNQVMHLSVQKIELTPSHPEAVCRSKEITLE